MESDRLRAGFTGADTNDFFQIADEHLAVTDLAGAGGVHDGLNDLLDHVVIDGEFELRRYQPLSRRLVLAFALQGTRTASLRRGRELPQVYWKEYGGEGSLRGVRRNAVQAVGGGRIGVNLRGELRYQRGSFGLVGFWDRAQVWHEAREVRLRRMVDGYGVGLRNTLGFPLRLDLAFNDGFDAAQRIRFYFSIGQAF